MSQVLIVEQYPKTTNILIKLFNALRVQLIHILNWNPAVQQFDMDNLCMMYINIEIEGFKLPELIKYINNSEVRNNKIPVVFLYNSIESDAYETGMSLPHFSEIRKPFKLEHAYAEFEKIAGNKSVTASKINVKQQLKSHEDFYNEFTCWMENFRILINT